ncbi:MAG: hypothetical protein Q7S26_04285 [bacterium]|nr:hypothetical protein [bacterium]
MATYTSKIVEFGGQACLVFPDELCKETGIKVGDTVDVDYDNDRNCIIVKLIKK